MTSKKEVMTFLSTNKKVLEDMEITVLFGNSIKTEDIEGIEAYLEKVDTNKEYNDITYRDRVSLKRHPAMDAMLLSGPKDKRPSCRNQTRS